MSLKAGRYLTPDQFEPSIHAMAEKDATPLSVVRGNPSGLQNLGSPAVGYR
jgi:hypothetical protein